jgi:hypothetical protein
VSGTACSQAVVGARVLEDIHCVISIALRKSKPVEEAVAIV